MKIKMHTVSMRGAHGVDISLGTGNVFELIENK